MQDEDQRGRERQCACRRRSFAELGGKAPDQEQDQQAVARVNKDVDGMKTDHSEPTGMVQGIAQFQQRPHTRHGIPPGPNGLHPGIPHDGLPVVELEARLKCVGIRKAHGEHDNKRRPPALQGTSGGWHQLLSGAW